MSTFSFSLLSILPPPVWLSIFQMVVSAFSQQTPPEGILAQASFPERVSVKFQTGNKYPLYFTIYTPK